MKSANFRFVGFGFVGRPLPPPRGGATVRAMLDPRKHCELLTPAEMGEADRLTIAGGGAGIAIQRKPPRSTFASVPWVSPA